MTVSLVSLDLARAALERCSNAKTRLRYICVDGWREKIDLIPVAKKTASDYHDQQRVTYKFLIAAARGHLILNFEPAYR